MSLQSVLCGFLLVFALASPPALAADGYTGEAPVNSQSDSDRAQGMKTALANVVIAQTGDGGALERADVAKAIAQADHYMSHYSYRRNPGVAPGSGEPALTLVVQFDGAAVDEMLRRLGLASAGGGGAPVGAGAEETDTSSDTTAATVWIGGIRSAEDYAHVMNYLTHSNLVSSAQPVRAQADGIRVRLSLNVDLAHFLDAIGLERTLDVTNTPAPGGGKVDATLSLAQ